MKKQLLKFKEDSKIIISDYLHSPCDRSIYLNNKGMNEDQVINIYASVKDELAIKIKLWEISLVTIPANAEAMITDTKSLESIENIKELNQLLKGYGISNKKSNIIISKMKDFVRDEQNGNKERDVLKSCVEETKRFIDEIKNNGGK